MEVGQVMFSSNIEGASTNNRRDEEQFPYLRVPRDRKI